MNILTLTNTYTPHVGGVARSVEAFTNRFRKRGHRDLVIAPVFEGMPKEELDVVRIPAIQNFNGSDFSVELPIPALLFSKLEQYHPDIVHSNHPFLLGDTALRIATVQHVPLVFTHHTRYEEYTHYVPGDSPGLQRFAIELATGYANLCDAVIAPSESIASLIETRGVKSPITVIPTGVDIDHFKNGDGHRIRRYLGIPNAAFVIGHVGRLAEEKNLSFLTRAVIRFLTHRKDAHFLVAGTGTFEERLIEAFERTYLSERLHLIGRLDKHSLVDLYHAFNCFAFASQSETQGMVLTEAMAAGVPVVAVDASGVREVVVDKKNGRLLPHEDLETFCAALYWMEALGPNQRKRLRDGVLQTAASFSMERSVSRALALYKSLIQKDCQKKNVEESHWFSILPLIKAEWELWVNRAHAAKVALSG